MKNGKYQVGIIGTGWIAESHAEAYNKMADVEVVALADIIPGKAEKFKARYNLDKATCYGHHSELVAANKELELDAVSICTYNRQHAEPTIDCLNAGINVLLEKPMCVTLDEAIEMVKAEKASGKILSIGFQPRFDSSMKLMKEVVRSGELGKVFYIQTGGGRRRGIPGSTFIEDETAGLGALADIGCYSLDMCLDAIGYPKPLTVSGFKSAYIGQNPKQYAEANRFTVDDFAAAFIRLEGGVMLDFRIAWAMNVDTPGDTIILGTEGGLRIPSTDCWNGGFDDLTLYKTIAGKNVETKIPVPKGGFDDCFYLKCRKFLEATSDPNGKAPVPTSQIIYNQAILDGIVRSHNLGKEVEIEIPEL